MTVQCAGAVGTERVANIWMRSINLPSRQNVCIQQGALVVLEQKCFSAVELSPKYVLWVAALI
jgi:hypothetical protein